MLFWHDYRKKQKALEGRAFEAQTQRLHMMRSWQRERQWLRAWTAPDITSVFFAIHFPATVPFRIRIEEELFHSATEISPLNKTTPYLLQFPPQRASSCDSAAVCDIQIAEPHKALQWNWKSFIFISKPFIGAAEIAASFFLLLIHCGGGGSQRVQGGNSFSWELFAK